MGIVGGTPRTYGGGEGSLGKPQGWKCPACGNVNVVPQEQGCPACGVGTAEEAARVAAQARNTVTAEQLAQAVVALTPEDTKLVLPPLNDRAALTLVRALSHYAEHGRPLPDELPVNYLLAWARDLNTLMGD